MPRLMTMAVVRNPKPAPPRRSDKPIIQTHLDSAELAESATAKSGTLHDRLRTAWTVSDWTALAGIARHHLEATGPLGPDLHAYSKAAIAYLQPELIAATDADLRLFLADFDQKALKSYLIETLPVDRGRLADHALALHCVGALGSAASDPVMGLRCLHAFGLLAEAASRKGERGGRRLVRTLERAVRAEVAFPRWTFEIDVCGDVHLAEGGKVRLAPTPLEEKLQRLDRFRDLANKGDCDCKPADPVCTPQSVCCPELKYYLADLLELRDWTHRYKAGDLAYIEVVGAGESRRREHVMKRVSEVYDETESTVRSLDKRDHQVTESGSLSREIERQNETKLAADASVEGTYDAKAYKITASTSLSYDKNASQSIREAQEQARETITSAVAEIEKTVRALRTERVTTEETETNTHAWENGGDEPRVTKYFWVTQEKRAQLYSHGKRLMAELIIPSPARLYERLVFDRLEAEVRRRVPAFERVAPPVTPPLTLTAADLTRENYAEHAATHGVNNAALPPEAAKYLVATGSYGEVKNEQKSMGQLQLTVPDGYHAVQMVLSGEATFRQYGTGQGRWVRFTLGSVVWFGGAGHSLTAGLASLTGQLAVEVTAANIKGCQASITIACDLDAAAFATWQQSVFDLISAAHAAKAALSEAAMADFLEALAEHKAAEERVRSELREKAGVRHPFFNRSIERTELKRAFIYLLCEDYSAESAWIDKSEPCGLPEIDRHAAAERGYGWYFWDRLFDWKYMAYGFFDYFWNPICDWAERFEPAHADPMFKAFLGAGYARVLVPVSASMEQDFLWYAATRQKWGQSGDPPLDAEDPRWRNVLYELKYASESAMTPREGHAANVAPGDLSVLIKDTDRYWDNLAAQTDAAAVEADLDRELFIDGAVYFVADIQPEPGSPPFTGDDTMWWRITLDRPYQGPAAPRRLYSLGAQAVAPAFTFDMPTELIWAGAHDGCLPSYPLPACVG